MRDDSVLIIGAGLAGLSAGVFAQLNGYRSHILEHHSVAGGVAASWRRRDYLIDGGIHFLMGHKPGTSLYDLYRQLGILPGTRVADMASYARFVDEDTGNRVDVTPDLARLAADLQAMAPDDSAIIARLISGAQGMRGLDFSQFGMSAPPELTGTWGSVKELWEMRRLWRYLVGPFARPVSDFARPVQAAWLRTFLENLFLPTVPVYFVCMLLAMLADGQLGLLEGGCREFVAAIERRYRQLGGEITYHATAAKILVDSTPSDRPAARATGVHTQDGREFRAGAVISTADGQSTLFEMLGGRYLTKAIRDRYALWQTFPPLMMISYGVARSFAAEPAFSALNLARPLAVAGRSVPGFFLRIFNYGTDFAPAGKTVLQVEFETDWDFWHDLRVRDRAAYDAEKAGVAATVLERLEAYYPGLAAQVEVTDVATPYTTWRYTLNRRGAWEGWQIMPSVMMTPIERTLPGLGGFFMAGQWVMPGGGVPPVLYSGRHAVQLMCRRDGRPFTAGADPPTGNASMLL